MTMSTRPLFLVPLRFEALAARAGAVGCEVERIGLGPVRATAARTRVTRERPAGRPLVLIGVAGALRSGLEPGTVVLGESVALLDSNSVLPLDDPGVFVARLAASGLDARSGPIVSSPRLVTGDAERRAAATQGLVVDMESFWCAPLATRHPLVVCRVVIDVPGRDVTSLATPLAAARAWRALVRAARVLSAWSSATLEVNQLLEVGDH